MQADSEVTLHGRMGRMAASVANKEFARQFALVVVTPTDRLNDMVARSGYVVLAGDVHQVHAWPCAAKAAC